MLFVFWKHIRIQKKNYPFFAIQSTKPAFGKQFAAQISKMLAEDAVAAKLDEIAKLISQIEFEEDHSIVARIDFELAQLIERCDASRRQITRRQGNL